MTSGSQENFHALSRRLYGWLLAAYPSEFRREFGREMTLVFQDRCRDVSGGGASLLARVWFEAVVDLILTAPKEHAGKFAGGSFMRIARTILLALAAYAFALLVAAPLYVRHKDSMPSFLGNMADALIATGVVFNIVFLILTLPRFVEGVRAVRVAAVVTGFIITGLIVLMVVSGGPPARPHFFVYVAQVLSLLIWFALHMWWVLRRRRPDAGPPAPA